MQFPIVYAPELHYQEFSSVLADMKNSVKVCSLCACENLCTFYAHVQCVLLKSNLLNWKFRRSGVSLFVPTHSKLM